MPAIVSPAVIAEFSAGDYAMLSRLYAARTSSPDHEIHLSHPAAAITAIRDVITAVREQRSLP
jgi:hypothetical protein